jgi:hypothetical protein
MANGDENSPASHTLRYLRDISAKLDRRGERLDVLTERVSELEKRFAVW